MDGGWGCHDSKLLINQKESKTLIHGSADRFRELHKPYWSWIGIMGDYEFMDDSIDILRSHTSPHLSSCMGESLCS